MHTQPSKVYGERGGGQEELLFGRQLLSQIYELLLKLKISYYRRHETRGDRKKMRQIYHNGACWLIF